MVIQELKQELFKLYEYQITFDLIMYFRVNTVKFSRLCEVDIDNRTLHLVSLQEKS